MNMYGMCILHLSIVLAILAAVILIRYVIEKQDMLNDRWKNVYIGLVGLLIVILFFYCVPVLISCFVFSSEFELLNRIPGKGEQWFSFWASYSGAAATVLIAIFTYINSKSIEEQKKHLLRLFTGNNLRLAKVFISQYKPVSEREETRSFKIVLKFTNLSYSMIEDIEVRGFYIRLNGGSGINGGGQRGYKRIENGLGACSYLLQGDIPYLIFNLTFTKGSEEEKKFTNFYYDCYFNNDNKLDVKIVIKPHLYEVKKQEDITLNITLLMTVHKEKEWRALLYSSDRELFLPANEVLIYCYSVQGEE